jgi:hypothetical protein
MEPQVLLSCEFEKFKDFLLFEDDSSGLLSSVSDRIYRRFIGACRLHHQGDE